MTRPKLNIEGYIGPNDPWMIECFGEDEMFSPKNMREFLEANAEATEIDIEIRSDGGYIADAMDIHDQLLNCGKTVFVVGYNVKSAAVAIFLAAPKENRSLTKHAEFLIHEATIDAWNLGNLTADKARDLANDLDAYNLQIANLYVETTGQTLETIQSKMKEDKLMSSADAMVLGFCSNILNGAQASNVKNENKPKFITPLLAKLIQNNTMANPKNDDKISKLESLFAKFENLLAKKVKNKSEKTKDGKTSVYYAEEVTSIEVGTALFSDEAMTVTLPAGDYTMEDDTVVTTDDKGIVTKVVETDVENVELEKVQNELAAEKERTQNLQKELDKVKNESAEFAKNLTEEFKNLKSSLIGDSAEDPAKKKVSNSSDKLSIADIAAQRAK